MYRYAMAMHFGAHKPSPVLSPFIESLWSLSDAPAHARERIFPSGNIELVINLAEDGFMTPKRYGRVRRSQRALASATATDSPHWGKLALEHGYFDQAHLCRGWSELAGLSPSLLIAQRQIPVKENHVALPDQGVKSVQDVSRRST
jgi:hypothetical protein